MKTISLRSGYYAAAALVGLAFVVAPVIASAATLTVNQSTGDDNGSSPFATIQAAIDAATPGDTVDLQGDFTITEQVNINKSITLDGNGNTIDADFFKTSNSNNSAIGVGADNVTIQDVVVDGANGDDLHGINVYESIGVVIDTVTAKYFRTGFVVNGSTVNASDITTDGNAWHGINVDQGSGVTQPAVLNISNTSEHGETPPIPHIYIDDISKSVTVNDVNNQYGSEEFTNPQDETATARAYYLSDEEPVDYCDPSQKPGGMDIAQWHEENDFDGDSCFSEVEVTNQCGFLDVGFTEGNDTPYEYSFRYVIGDETPTLGNWEGDGELPVNFDEDEHGGSVDVTYYLVGPEGDYFADSDVPNIWDGNGETVTVGTDCDDGEEDKILICHAAGQSGNYTKNEVAKPGLNGHDGHSHSNDIIPPFGNGDFENGQNWDEEGQAIYENECAIPEPELATQCTVTITSDEANTVVEKDGDNAKLLTFIHNAWTAAISGADWIWGDDPVVDPEVEETQTFLKKFGWNGPVTSATLEIASDNTHSFDLNGIVDGDSSENNFGTQDSYDVSGAIEQGNNTLSIAVTNLAREGHTAEQNPAGLLYKLTITGSAEECGVPYEEDPWCTFEGKVIDHTPNSEARQNDEDLVDSDRRDTAGIEDGPAPYANFGGSEGNDWSTDDFFSLGIGGFVTYEFTGQVAFDQSGNDIAIYETTGNTANTEEKVEVFVSQYGVQWHSLGVHTGDIELDISSAGLDYVKFVKLVDKSQGVQGNNGDGYDVDAIVILQGSCGDKPAVQCEIGKELLENGGFENPTVTHNAQWDIFELGHAGLGWAVKWFGGNTTYGGENRPEKAQMELQKDGLQGWLAASGSEQWTELDADWFGPDNPLNGEPGAVSISQTVGTEVGETYTFSFDFSPRPNTDAEQNKVEVLANGQVIDTVGPDATAGNQTEWNNYSFDFVATTTQTTFALRDAGTPNDSMGSFVDNASLMCTEPEEPKDTITVEKWNDEDGDSEWSEGEEGISGWDIVVKPESIDPIETITVDAADENGTTTNISLDSEKTYLIEASGTWLNDRTEGPNYVDAEYSTIDGWDTHMNGFTGFGEDILELKIDGDFVEWGSYNDAHLYKTVITGSDAPVSFQVHENGVPQYNDNEGELTVRIYDVTEHVVTTGDGGSAEVEVAPGEYQVVEVMQGGWTQTAPTGPSYCHIDTREDEDLTCAFGNMEEEDDGGDTGGGSDPEPQMDTITVGKYEDADQDGNWGEESGIAGWDVVVKPQSIDPDETFSVDSSEEAGVMSGVLQDGKVYLVEVEGTYQFDSDTDRVADAEYYSNNNWSDEGDWGSDNLGDDPRTLDLIIDEQNINWGGYTDDPHLYKTVITGSDESLNFRIFERLSSHYADNEGSLDVRIYDVTNYVHTTDESGYVGVEVPEGTYQVVEIMRDGWVQTEPSGPSYCHIDTTEVSEPKCIFGNYKVDEEPDLTEGTADVFVEKFVDGDMGIGGTITYTIDVENNGPDTATNVVLTDVLPEGVTYVSDNSGGDYSTTTGEWYIGTLSDGSAATETLTITATVNEETGGDDIANTATVGSDQEDPNLDNNTDTATFKVEGVVIDTTNGGGSDDGESENNGRGGVGGGGVIGGPNSFGFRNSNPSNGGGQVLGATTVSGEQTQCVPEYLTQYLRLGSTGDQVTLLQAFLNGHINAGLAINGTFDQQTHNAVEKFQSMYADEILAPWGTSHPTGYVYYTTQKKINELACGDRLFPLTQEQLEEIDRIRNQPNQNSNQTSSGLIGGTTREEEGKENTELTEEETQEDGSQTASVGNTDQEGGFWNWLKGLF